MARHLYTFENPTNSKHIQDIVRVLQNGGLIIYPTDVNWALGCDGTNAGAVTKIYNLKTDHPREKPLSLIMNSISQIAEYATVSSTDYRILKKCLPGPYTFLLKRHRRLPKQIGDKRQIVGVRVPDCPLLKDIIDTLGKPLATSSLPLPEGRKHAPYAGWEVASDFATKVDIILDLGKDLLESQTTVVDLTGEVPILVRQGVGPTAWLEELGLKRLKDPMDDT